MRRWPGHRKGIARGALEAAQRSRACQPDSRRSHLLWGSGWCCPSSLTGLSASCASVMLIVCGALVNGPYALITTAVSADLVGGAASQEPGEVTLGAWSGPLSPGPFSPQPFPLPWPVKILKVLQNLPSTTLSSQLRARHRLSPGQPLSHPGAQGSLLVWVLTLLSPPRGLTRA